MTAQILPSILSRVPVAQCTFAAGRTSWQIDLLGASLLVPLYFQFWGAEPESGLLSLAVCPSWGPRLQWAVHVLGPGSFCELARLLPHTRLAACQAKDALSPTPEWPGH